MDRKGLWWDDEAYAANSSQILNGMQNSAPGKVRVNSDNEAIVHIVHMKNS